MWYYLIWYACAAAGNKWPGLIIHSAGIWEKSCQGGRNIFPHSPTCFYDSFNVFVSPRLSQIIHPVLSKNTPFNPKPRLGCFRFNINTARTYQNTCTLQTLAQGTYNVRPLYRGGNKSFLTTIRDSTRLRTTRSVCFSPVYFSNFVLFTCVIKIATQIPDCSRSHLLSNSLVDIFPKSEYFNR